MAAVIGAVTIIGAAADAMPGIDGLSRLKEGNARFVADALEGHPALTN